MARKKVKIANFKKVLANIERKFSEGDEDDKAAWVEALNTMLDDLHADDFFGTEGQNDPRGDQRD